MKHQSSRGFTAVEGVIIAVIVLALAGVGYWVFNRQSKEDSKTPALSQGGSLDAPAVPELNSTNDLDGMEQALGELNFDAGTADNTELSAQASGF